MTDGFKAPPVPGYTDVSAWAHARVKENKELEEQVLRQIDHIAMHDRPMGVHDEPAVDPRWLAIARAHIEQGFMALNRSIFKPQRIKLPGDEAHP